MISEQRWGRHGVPGIGDKTAGLCEIIAGRVRLGTGATAIQVIGEIADKVGELTVFQRRPNWSAPLNNSPISDVEMADIRARYDEIFAACKRTLERLHLANVTALLSIFNRLIKTVHTFGCNKFFYVGCFGKIYPDRLFIPRGRSF